MRKIIIVLLLLNINSLKAQRFNTTVFDKLPQDYQLYPRNDKNESKVPIIGKIEELGWSYCSIQIFRENKLIGYQRANLVYSNSVGNFQFSPLTIKAELAEYSFKIYTINNKGDSVQVVYRQHIVSGDSFVIGGQSNALALVNEGDIPYHNKFARTFGGGYPYDPNMIWQLSEYGNVRVGHLGGGLQQQIIENYKIPVCIINQAIGGINLGLSLIRNENNLSDLSNNYGITYNRVQQAGLLNGGVKAFIWRQGENESSGGAGFWGGLFDRLYNYWRKDYPDIHKYYIFQVGLIAWPERYAGELRDYQRRTKTIYDNVDNIACVGTRGYDGIHYDTSGHNQTAKELFRMIDRDFYGGKYNENVNSPNVQKAYFSKSDKMELTLEFESDQRMVWINDTILIDKKGNPVKQFMKNMFYFDFNSKNDLVTNGRALNNKIILTLNAQPPSNKFNYLPPFHDDQVFKQFGGPFLINKIGMRAFSFDGVTIEDYVISLTKPELIVNVLSSESLKISWKSVSKATSYILERKLLATDSFKELIRMDAAKTEYIDSSLPDNTICYYRLKAVGDNTESNYGTAQGSTNAKLVKPELAVNVLSFESLKISWKSVSKATSYVLERKLLATDSFKELVKLDASKTEHIDLSLSDNTVYFYRLKALGDNTESDYGTAQGSTKAKLAKPELAVNALSFESLKISWKSVSAATSYVLERKLLATDSFKELVKLDAVKMEHIDLSLPDNTVYYYRLKAFGDNTESDYAIVQGSTNAKLAKPELAVNTMSFESLKISWKSVDKAKSYVLERKLLVADSFKELVKLDAFKTEYIDLALKDNTLFYYRLKALGDNTASDYGIAQGSTSMILAVDMEIQDVFTLFPNPANSQIIIRFKQPITGKLSIIKLNGLICFEEDLTKISEKSISVNNYLRGIYFVCLKNNDNVLTKKIVIE